MRSAVRVVIALAVAGAVLAPPPIPAAARRPAPHLGDRSLRPGAGGRDVRELQRLLSRVGIEVKADGRFGPATTAAVRQFQEVARLRPSGIVGPRTARALIRAANGGSLSTRSGGVGLRLARPARPPSEHLGDRIPVGLGMRGHDIRVLQDLLGRTGVRTRIDGRFGKATWQAVRAFEAAAARPVDGVVDATDIAALRQLAGAGLPPPGDPSAPPPVPPEEQAQLSTDGLAVAPASAPDAVKAIIDSADRIAAMPYRYGGGHAAWDDTGYDCSGSVSYALHGAGLLDAPMASGDFTRLGEAGVGHWVTLYASDAHVYMIVAGLRFDTSGAAQDGTRWHATMRTSSGYTVRHIAGL